MTTNDTARRATIYRDADGKWRYKVQAANWRTIDASEEGFAKKATARRRVEKRWPGVEVVER
jgi:uncharacterized protein YegP (UPF0339 family)